MELLRIIKVIENVEKDPLLAKLYNDVLTRKFEAEKIEYFLPLLEEELEILGVYKEVEEEISSERIIPYFGWPGVLEKYGLYDYGLSVISRSYCISLADKHILLPFTECWDNSKLKWVIEKNLMNDWSWFLYDEITSFRSSCLHELLHALFIENNVMYRKIKEGCKDPVEFYVKRNLEMDENLRKSLGELSEWICYLIPYLFFRSWYEKMKSRPVKAARKILTKYEMNPKKLWEASLRVKSLEEL